MGLSVLFLMVIIVPCLISAQGGHNAVVQKIAGIEQFVPPREGCVGWVTLDASKDCKWCREMFRQVLGALHKTYHSTEHFYSPAALVASHNPPQSYRRDMKGTCFINYLITDNYKGLGQIFNPQALKKIRTKNWVVFIQGEKTSHFLKCWANTMDANFGRVFPKVVLIMMHTMKIENDGYAPSDLPGTGLEPLNYMNGRAAFGAAVACYMCPEGKSYFVGIQQGEKNPYNLLKKAGDRKGYLGPPGISPEAAYFNSWRTTPNQIDRYYYMQTIFFAVQAHLNFTYIKNDPKSGLIMETGWSWHDEAGYTPNFESARPIKVFLSKESRNLVYCRQTQETNKYIAALISPFKKSAWVAFLATVTSICLVAGVRFWGGLDLLWLLQGHPPQAKKIGALLILASIIMYPIQVLYKEYYASNAMTPYEMEYLDTNLKIFESNFKYICDDPEGCVKDASMYLSGENLHLDMKSPGQYFIRPEELGTTIMPDDNKKRLAFGRDVATHYYDDRRLKDVILLEHESYIPDTKCYMAEEYWWVEEANWYITGPLSEAMHDTLQMLRESGITDFWYNIPIVIEDRRRRSKLSQSTATDNEVDDYDSGMKHMNKTLMSLVVVFLASGALSVLCLLVEILVVSGKLVARWKRWRERRRYLRAIWPLGKI